jgi:hypothetical protein
MMDSVEMGSNFRSVDHCISSIRASASALRNCPELLEILASTRKRRASAQFE